MEEPAMFNNSMLFIGLDLGDRHSHLVSLDQGGEIVEEARLPTTQASLARKFSGTPACLVAIEVGAHSRWVSALLTRLGHEVLVADARKLRLIYNNPRKHDRADAEYLARLAKPGPGPLPPRLPPPQPCLPPVPLPKASRPMTARSNSWL